MMPSQFRRLLKTQAEILKEVRAQTVLLREIRDKEPDLVSEMEDWVKNAQTSEALNMQTKLYHHLYGPQPSCMDRLKKWWKKPESQEYRDNVDRIERLKEQTRRKV